MYMICFINGYAIDAFFKEDSALRNRIEVCIIFIENAVDVLMVINVTVILT